jgi:hypothetical protein
MTTKLLLAGTLILEDSSGCTEINDRVIETRRWAFGRPRCYWHHRARKDRLPIRGFEYRDST